MAGLSQAVHLPPAVDYPVRPSAFSHRLLWVLAAAWAVGLLLWVRSVGSGPLPGAWWASLAAGCLLLGWSLWLSRHPRVGQLSWSPHGAEAGSWCWHSAAYRRGTPVVALRVALDLQVALLVRAQTAAGLGLWLWLDAHHSPADWDALRRAVRAALPRPT